MPSTVLPGRGNSSTASATEPSGLVIGMTLRSKRPSAIAVGGAVLALDGERVDVVRG